MTKFEFNQAMYLKRINFDKKITTSFESLKALHHAQLFTIPFENFDIVLGKGINLTPNSLFQKLVQNNRGGYCFELNGLFLMALQAFGFNARGLLARVHVSGTPSGKSHQFTLVTINGKQWIADVGFGSGTMQEPIPLILDQITSNSKQTFRLIDCPPFGIMLQRRVDNVWKDQYSFTLEHIFPNDIAMANHYTSTSPDSFFTQSRVAVLPTALGINTLNNHLLKQNIGGDLIEHHLDEEQSYIDYLYNYFDIRLDATIEDFRAIQ
ncbi:MAG: arylamine N-acetyltransferase [Chloroflexota bacterium]